jgi:PAS domain S-box-containing protein
LRIQAKRRSAGRSLVTMLAVAFLGLSVLALVTSSVLQLFSTLQARETALSKNQQLIAQGASKAVSAFIQEKYSILETASWVTDPYSLSRERQIEMLQSLLGLEPAFRQLMLLDNEGQTSARASGFSLATSGRMSEELRSAVTSVLSHTNRATSPVMIDPITSEPMVIMTVPLIDVLEVFRGTLVAELNLKFMWDLVERLKVGEGGVAYVVNRRGDLIAFGDTARVLKGENVAHLEPVAEFLQSAHTSGPELVSRYTGIMGATVVGTYVPLKEPDWAVVTELPWREAYREVVEGTVVYLSITLGILFLAGAVGVSLARRLSIPLINLTQTASRIAIGERELQAPVDGPREVVELALAFNSMTAQLQQSLSELELQIAEVKRTEEALRVSEERFRLAMEGTTDGIWDWNLQTGNAYFSPRYYAMLGYEPNEFPASFESWRRLVHPDDLPAAEKVVLEALKGNAPYVVEFRMGSKSGEWIWILGRGKVVERDDQGNAVRVAGSHSDIGARKQVEQALEESRSVLEATMESIKDGLLVVSSEGIISHHNARFREMWAIDAPIEIGGPDKDLIEYVLPQIQEPERFLDRILELYDSTDIAEDVLHLKDGRVLERISYPLIRDGLEGGRVWLFRDVTERMRHEEELRQRTDELTRFIYTVSHDMKTPLVTIRTFTGFLKQDIESQDSERIAKDLRFIDNASEKLSRLLDELLELSRIGRKVNPPVDVTLQELVGEALMLVAGAIIQRDVEVRVTEERVLIRGERSRLIEVFQNLLDNAVKFMGDQTEPAIEVGVQEAETGLVIFVRDNGMGIDPRFRHKVFDLFEKLEPNVEGTGIGLALVKRIIEVHGGRVWVESAGIGKGTTFYFSLPESRRIS